MSSDSPALSEAASTDAVVGGTEANVNEKVKIQAKQRVLMNEIDEERLTVQKNIETEVTAFVQQLEEAHLHSIRHSNIQKARSQL